ncbi:hypothetical protein [Chromobacterium subtsugae]|uniref:hypothetical protein n=1 Tax=Chromobacterium subtsugae TaxID=251747 RepID=UPI000AF8CA30|nr:hypothetical protein [Chromobacterium subtsugae]
MAKPMLHAAGAALRCGWEHLAGYAARTGWGRLLLTALLVQILGGMLRVPALTLILILATLLAKLQAGKNEQSKQEAHHE